jgi:hypothetical protein
VMAILPPQAPRVGGRQSPSRARSRRCRASIPFIVGMAVVEGGRPRRRREPWRSAVRRRPRAHGGTPSAAALGRREPWRSPVRRRPDRRRADEEAAASLPASGGSRGRSSPACWARKARGSCSSSGDRRRRGRALLRPRKGGGRVGVHGGHGGISRVLQEVRWGGGDAGASSSGGHGGISSWGRRPHLRRPPLPPQLLARRRCFSPRAGRRRAPHLATPSPSPFLLPARNANGPPWAPSLVLSRESLPPLDLKEMEGRRDFEVSLEETAAADKTLSVSSRRRIKAPMRMV